MPEPWYDAVVVGAGFGGLATALELAQGGARVALCESLNYPGGCASTFRRDGYAFEAGATLFSGLAEQQLFGQWMRRHALSVEVDWIDPLVELRTPSLRLSVPRDRQRFVEQLCQLPGAPVLGLRGFFALQRELADALWALFEDPSLLPPLDARALLRHAARVPRYLPLLRWVGRPLEKVLVRFGIERFAPLRTYLDGLCQITVQCSAAEAEAPFALAAMDYYWRGTGHVRGGIGRLAEALAGAIVHCGGEVMLANRVKSVTPEPGGWRVVTRRGELRARHVAANLLPRGMMRLLGMDPERLPRLEALAGQVADGWGAAMLYRVVRAPEAAAAKATHLQLVQDEAAPLVEGNHLFVSISGEADTGRAPEGFRTLTISTHVPLRRWAEHSGEEQGRYIHTIQTRMREVLARLAPEWSGEVRHELTASPRTFERFTRREAGAVGGVPRRAGLAQYRELGPRPVMRGLWMVGDSVFPGQSTLATALGGVRTAARIAASR
jgi:phytoene dehydrogenase-like protein